MVVNFRARRISRGMLKLVRISTLIIIIIIIKLKQHAISLQLIVQLPTKQHTI